MAATKMQGKLLRIQACRVEQSPTKQALKMELNIGVFCLSDAIRVSNLYNLFQGI